MSVAVVRVLLAAVLLAGCSAASSGSAHTTRTTPQGAVQQIGATYFAPTSREPMPRIEGTTLAGPHLSVADLFGQAVVVVNVWASWCIDCRAESRGLATLASTLHDDVRFVGIDEQDVAAKARAFAAAARTDYPQLIDPDGTLLAKLTMVPSSGIPSTLVVDRHGRVAARIIGAAQERQLHDLIERVVADR